MALGIGISAAPAPAAEPAHVGVVVIGTDPVAAGTHASFRLVPHNLGGATTGTATVWASSTDLESVTLTGIGWDCDGSRCERTGAIPEDDTLPEIRATGVLRADRTTTATLSATVSGPFTSGDAARASIPIVVDHRVDTTITATALEPWRPGEPVDYRFRVANAGTAPTTGPLTVTFGSPPLAADGDGWQCDPAAARCTTDTAVAPDGEAPPLTVRASPDALYVGSRSLRATVTGGGETVTRTNGSVSGRAFALETADVDLVPEIEAGPPSPDPGRQTFTVRARNTGAVTTARPMSIRLRTDEQESLGKATVEPGDGWTCDPDHVCRTEQALTPGARSTPIQVAVAPKFPFDDDALARLRATVSSDEDPGTPPQAFSDATNDTVDAVRRLSGGAERPLDLVLSGTTGLVRGETGRAVIRVVNRGVDARTAPVEVSVTAPEDARPAGDGWWCIGSVCRWDATIDAGDSTGPLSIDVETDDDTPDSNLVVTAAGPETARASSAFSVGGPRPRLAVLLPDVPPLVAGRRDTVPVRVVNDAGVLYPESVRLVTQGPASGTGWTCRERSDGGRTCTHPGPVAARATLPDLDVERYVADDTDTGQADTSVRLLPPRSGPRPATSGTAVGMAGIGVRERDAIVTVTDAVPPTFDRPGHVSYRVTARGASVDGPVELRIGGADGASGDSWACEATSCTHPGPIPAGGALPVVRREVVRRSDDTGELDVGASLRVADGGPLNDNVRLLLPVPPSPGGSRLRVDAWWNFLPLQAGETVDATGEVLVTPNGTTAPTTLRVDPGPGIVVERIWGTGWTCPSARRCRAEDGVPYGGRRFSARIRATSDAAGPVPVRVRADADGVRSDDRIVLVTPRSSGVDLVSRLDDLPPVRAGTTADTTLRIRNAGRAALEDPVTVRLENRRSDSTPGPNPPYVATVTGEGAGWSCLRERCRHTGRVAAGTDLPPLRVLAEVSDVHRTGEQRSLDASVTTAGDTLTGNSGASIRLTVSGEGRPDLAVSRTADGPARPGLPTTFSTWITNTGRASARPGWVSGGGDEDAPGWTCEPGDLCRTDHVVAPGAATPTLTVEAAAPGPRADGDSRPARPVASGGSHADPHDPLSHDGASASTPVVPAPAPDLAVVVAGADGPVDPDATRFVVGVANHGTTATSVPPTVRLAGVLRSVEGDSWSCLDGGRRCRLADPLAPGEQAPPLTATVEDPPSGSAPSRHALTASVEPVDDTWSGNETGSASTVRADRSGTTPLTLLLTGAEPTAMGEEDDLELLVRNATGTAVDGPVEVGVILVPDDETWSGDGWTCDGARCTHPGPVGAMGTLPPLRSTVTVGPGEQGRMAFLYGDGYRDRSASFIRRPAAPRRYAVADVQVTEHTPEHAVAVATVHNVGVDPFRGPTVVRLGTRAETSYATLDVDASGDGWDCTGDTCRHEGRVAPGDALPPLRAALRPPVARTPMYHRVVAEVSTADESLPGDGGWAMLAFGIGAVDLTPRVVAIDGPTSGGSGRYRVTVRSDGRGGTDAPTTVTVDGTEGLPGATVEGEGWSCDGLVCRTERAVVAGGELPPLTVTVQTPEPLYFGWGSIRVSATVSNPDDGHHVNDTGGYSGGIHPAVPGPHRSRYVGIDALAPATGAPGDEVVLQVSAVDPAAATGRTGPVTVELPPGLRYVAATDGDPAPTVDGRTLRWDLTRPADATPVTVGFRAGVADGAAAGPRTVTVTQRRPGATADDTDTTDVVVLDPPPDTGGPDPDPADPDLGTGDGTDGGSTTPGPDATFPWWLFLPPPDAGASPAPGGDGGGTATPAPRGDDAPDALRVRFRGRMRPPTRRTFGRRGWSVPLRLSHRATVTTRVVADRATAKRLRVRNGATIGRVRRTLSAGSRRVRVLPTRRLALRINRARRVSGTLVVQARRSGLPTTTVTRRVRLR